jgi:AcrR family transcriptional regulator
MTTRPAARQEMVDRILATADTLFYSQGIRAVGVDTIAEEVGISKRTLYNHFPSKDDLVLAYLSRRAIPLKVTDDPPAQQLMWAFERLERAVSGKEFRGCPFVKAVSDMSDARHPVNPVALRFKEERRMWLQDRLAALKVHDPEGLSMQLHLLMEGAFAAALVRHDPGVARHAKAAARTLLRAAGVRLD